jgi:nitrogenase molybdenum-cofactor synthesis protein NifE
MEHNKINVTLNLKRLSKVRSDKSIKNGSPALYPGARCPLAVITNVLSGIKGASSLVVGMAECTYYNKNIALTLQEDVKTNPTWSYALESKEVIFGCKKGVLEALEEMGKTGVEVIFIISACVPETIGEDFEQIAREGTQKIHIPIISIQAAHFKAYSASLSIQETFQSLVHIMERQERREKTCNLIGQGANQLKNSELVHLLSEEGVEILNYIPCEISVEAIKNAPSAALNIVTDMSAMPLAKSMYELFEVPYVLFPHLLDVDEIKEVYNQIAECLGINFHKLEFLYIETKNKIDKLQEVLKGKTFGCGYFGLDPFVCSAFLTKQKMSPLYIETEYYFSENRSYAKEILAYGYDPYIGRAWDQVTRFEALEAFKPDYFFGIKMKKGKKDTTTSYIEGKKMASLLGFEQPLTLLEELIHQIREYKAVNA